jgi:hypothetical protein
VRGQGEGRRAVLAGHDACFDPSNGQGVRALGEVIAGLADQLVVEDGTG